MGKVELTETILRSTQQSFIPTRMEFGEVEPILATMDQVGYGAIDGWGGASFESELVYLGEDPWVRLRAMKKQLKKTNLAMTLRGQSLLGYRHYADDVATFFVHRAAANGIDLFRVIDGLNDVRNMETVMKAAKKEKKKVQAIIAYNECPAQDTLFFQGYAAQLESLGANSICIKDSAGWLSPGKIADLVTALKKSVKVPIHLQLHGIQDFVSAVALQGVLAGAEGVDTTISTLGYHSPFPSTEMMAKLLAKTENDPALNTTALAEVHGFFAQLRDKYIGANILSREMLLLDRCATDYDVPLGMLYNLHYQLKKTGKEELLAPILAEVELVRRDCGMPPLVSPFAQIVSAQSTLNVLAGSRYRTVTKEFKSLVRGEWGKTPEKIERMFRSMIVGDEPAIEERPADLLGPELPLYREEMPAEFIEQEEDVLTYSQCGKPSLAYFRRRRNEKYGIDSKLSDQDEQIYPV